MNVLVFGGCGNIGSYVASDLCDMGMRVAIFDQRRPSGILRSQSERFTWIEGDISDQEQVIAAVRRTGAQRIVHVAAILAFGIVSDPRRGMQVNIGGTVNVLEAAKQCSVDRVVFASTDSVCGEEAMARREDAPIGPTLSVYAASKFMGERIGALYSDQHGFQFIALRYSLTFGAGRIGSPGVAKAFEDLLGTVNGQSVTIGDFSSDWRQQVTYVRDAAAATVLAVTHDCPSYRAYNVAGPYENFITMAEFHSFLKMIEPQTGSATFTGPRRAGGPCDITRIQEDLGFKPRYTVADGIRARLEDLRRWG